MKRTLISIFGIVTLLTMFLTAIPAAALDGSGTCTVLPNTALAGSTGNTLTFTFTAAETMDGGAITIAAPALWSAPQGTGGTAGYTTCSSTGTTGKVLNNLDATTSWMDSGTFITLSAEGTIKKEGANSLKAVVSSSAGMGPPPDRWWFEYASGQNWSSYTKVGFWIRSSIALNAGDFLFAIRESTGSPPTESIPIPAIPTANTWTHVTLNLAVSTLGRDWVRGYGIDMGVDRGACDIYLDEILIGPDNASAISFVGQTATVRILALTNPQTITVTYGAGGGASGATAQPAAGTATFTTQTKRAADGTLTSIATSPTVTVTSPTYTLTMAVSPPGSGTATDVTNTPPYAAGTPVSITASPAAGYHFVNWTAPAGSFGDAGAASTTFTMPAQPVTVTANFAINTYTLTMAVLPISSGTATDLTNTSPYIASAPVNIQAVAATGYHFVNWTAPAGSFGSAAAASTTFTMPAQPVTVTANFAIDTHTLTVNKNGTGSGTVTGTGINCGGDCNETYDYNTGVTLTATPDASSNFTAWSGDGTGAAPGTRSVTMDNNRAVTATFTLKTFTLTYTAGANGSITGTSPQTVNYGGNGTQVTAVANFGYHFVNWSDASTTNPRTDYNVQADITVTANFEMDAPPCGTISSNTPYSISQNDLLSPYDDYPWINIDGIWAPDFSFANFYNPSGSSAYSWVIYAKHYDFNIPAGAIITGIRVEYERHSANGTVTDALVQLVKYGTPVGDNKSGLTWNPGTDTVANIGGNGDLWGTTWTPADINDDGFGVAIAAEGVNGATAYIDDMDITIYYSTPTANFIASTTAVCEGQTVTFTDQSVGATTWNWTFNGGDPASAGGQGPHTVTYNSAGTYTVSLTVTNACGSDDEIKTDYIIVNALPVATAGSNSLVCEGATISLTGGPDGMTTYSWLGPDGWTSTDQNPTRTNATLAMDGTYTLTVTNSNGCQDTETTDVTVNALPRVEAGPDQSFCVDSAPISLTGTGEDPAPGTWSGDGVTGSTFDPAAAGLGPHTITYTCTNPMTQCANSATKTFTVYACPTANAGPDQTTFLGSPLQLNGNPSGGSGVYNTHSWIGDGATYLSATTIPNPVFTCNIPGTYDLTYTVTDSNNCTGSASISITVNPPPRTGGAAGPETYYLIVDMLGKRTMVEMNYLKNITKEKCQAYDKDQEYLLAFPKGTEVLCGDCDGSGCYPKIIVMSPSDESITPPDGMAIVGPIFDFTGYKDLRRLIPCHLVTSFDPVASVLLNYNPELMPEGGFNPVIGFYSHEQGQWILLPPDTGVVAAVGVATGLTDYFASPFAVLVSVPPTTPATPEPTPPTPKPAHFVASGLNITPAEVKAGETVTVSLNLANDGETAGSYTVELKINGQTIDSKAVTLNGGQSEAVSFTVSSTEAGTYEASASGLSGSFTVEAASNWWIYLIIAAVVILGGVLVFLIRKRV